jgi:hypothetical protein
MSLMPIRLEQVTTLGGQDHRSVVGAQCRRAQQTLLFEVALGLASVVAAIVEVAFGDDAESADGGERPAFGAVDLVDAIAVSHWPTLMATWQVEIPREHVARVTIGCMVAFAAPAAAAAVSVAEVVSIAVI